VHSFHAPRKIREIVFQQISILAPGLLGASLAQAVRKHGVADKISVWARRPEARLQLQEAAWCDSVFSAPQEACREAELTIVCTPVERIPELVGAIRDSLPPGAIVTDVGSVKSLICRKSHHLIGDKGRFIGSHPMAGSEKSGMEHARDDLFVRRPCFVTPLEESDPEAAERVVAFWRALEADVMTMNPEEHDEIVAHISHLPHVIASTLCSFLGLKDSSWIKFGGAGLRDTTRVAAGNTEMWREILQQNRSEILRALRAYQDELHGFQTALANEDYYLARHFLDRGKAYRDKL
jgi:prephenate dehydrogenase